MNTETGKIYKTVSEIEAAKKRGETLIELSPGVQTAHVGANRKQRRAKAAEMRKAAKR